MRMLLSVSIALAGGLMMTRVFKMLHLNFPDVTAFLIAGLIVGPFGIGRFGIEGIGFPTVELVEQVSALSNVALGFIAFAIGSEFRLEELKKTGRQATIVGIFQAVMATALVDAALIGLHFVLGEEVLPMPVAITMGAIAAATAPAATLMVVRQYKAKGPVTKILLPIVALDDAVGLVVFAVSFGIAMAMQGGELSVISVIVNPLIEIVGSLLLGSLLGWIMTKVETLFYSNSNRLSMTISFVILTIALSSMTIELGPVTVSFSSLLVCMMLGTIFCNMSDFSADIMERASKWTAPLYAVFFVLSGAELDLGILTRPLVVMIGVVYILTRCLGKYVGARISSTIAGCDENIRKYLGITLFPQAGVALGMCVTAQALGGEEAQLVRSITLFGVLIYELIGPTLTRDALTKAGEITPTPSEKKDRSRFLNSNHPRWREAQAAITAAAKSVVPGSRSQH